MTEEITRIRYRWGLTENLSDLGALPGIELRAEDIPAKLQDQIRSERILDLVGSRGDRSLGFPIEVDDLVVDTNRRRVHLHVFNRCAELISGDDDEIVRIHRVCCSLQRLLPPSGGVRVQVLRQGRSAAT